MCLWNGGEAIWVDTVTPSDALKLISHDISSLDVHRLVIEKFALYPDKAALLIGSEMETSQMIGALKMLAWENDVAVVLQPASIKLPTESVLQHRHIPMLSKTQRKNIHAKDAEVHGHYYTLEGHKRYPDIRGSNLF